MSLTTRRGSSWNTDTETRQITELADAFREFTHRIPGLTVEVVGNVADDRHLVHPVAGFHVRLPGPNDHSLFPTKLSGVTRMIAAA